MAFKFHSAQESIKQIQSGHRVFIHGAVATPTILVEELVKQASRLTNVEIIHLHTESPADYAKPEYKSNFRTASLFVGANIRPYFDHEQNDYIPCFLSEMPSLFRKNIRRPDVALIQISTPDEHGYCSLGTSVDAAKAAVETATIVIAQVNNQMPRVFGDGLLSVDEIDFFVEGNIPLPEIGLGKNTSTPEEARIGQHVAGLIDDGSCLQMGIGTIPNAVMLALTNHKNLGIHTEMWSDGALPLIENGTVNNSQKKIHPGKTVSTFLMGTKKLYDFIHNNPSIVQLDASYVNNPHVIARNPNVVAINSAVEIDLTGQICADSVGSRIISGVGGQIDFIVGATLSENGKPIIALTSKSKKGLPRIVPSLKPGAGVVTTRAHVHTVVTEFGVAELFGKTLGERAHALIKIAHPEDQDELLKQWNALK